MLSNEDRFGIPEENLLAAKKWVDRQSNKQFQSYVPTRREVANLATKKITSILVDWMCRSPVEIIPSRTQIIEVRDILSARADAKQLTGLITMCNYYINND
ncbi:hypothetical protein [Undibacterium hunanense]|uniref:hypothetical protein n=1 Tax=Undibacterium hunanense TaxID=2762292 RepID=UPI001C9ACA53|nr:hypothetical protein [Undibacterium hunanense]